VKLPLPLEEEEERQPTGAGGFTEERQPAGRTSLVSCANWIGFVIHPNFVLFSSVGK
jgi:hypothetical protein